MDANGSRKTYASSKRTPVIQSHGFCAAQRAYPHPDQDTPGIWKRPAGKVGSGRHILAVSGH